MFQDEPHHAVAKSADAIVKNEGMAQLFSRITSSLVANVSIAIPAEQTGEVATDEAAEITKERGRKIGIRSGLSEGAESGLGSFYTKEVAVKDSVLFVTVHWLYFLPNFAELWRDGAVATACLIARIAERPGGVSEACKRGAGIVFDDGRLF